MSVQVTPDIYSSAITYFASGVSVPAGTYRIYYFNGAFQAASTPSQKAQWCLAEDWNYNMLEFIINVSGSGSSAVNGTYNNNYYYNPGPSGIDFYGNPFYVGPNSNLLYTGETYNWYIGLNNGDINSAIYSNAGVRSTIQCDLTTLFRQWTQSYGHPGISATPPAPLVSLAGYNTTNFNLLGRFYATNSAKTNVEIIDGNTGAYSTQAACEAANAGTYIEYVHTGGPLGVYLNDLASQSGIGQVYQTTYYPDHVAGSPNPTFGILGSPAAPTAVPIGAYTIDVTTPILPIGADTLNLYYSADGITYTLWLTGCAGSTMYPVTGLKDNHTYYFYCVSVTGIQTQGPGPSCNAKTYTRLYLHHTQIDPLPEEDVPEFTYHFFLPVGGLQSRSLLTLKQADDFTVETESNNSITVSINLDYNRAISMSKVMPNIGQDTVVFNYVNADNTIGSLSYSTTFWGTDMGWCFIAGSSPLTAVYPLYKRWELNAQYLIMSRNHKFWERYAIQINERNYEQAQLLLLPSIDKCGNEHNDYEDRIHYGVQNPPAYYIKNGTVLTFEAKKRLSNLARYAQYYHSYPDAFRVRYGAIL